MDIAVNNVSMRFDDAGREIEVFHGVTFTVQAGTSVAIVGESGVGKTTLLYILGGLERPTAGEVCIGGAVLKELAGTSLTGFRGKNIGFIFQFHHLLPEFDAVENVGMPLLLRGEKWSSVRTRAEGLLERVKLGHRLDHRPGALSGGEQQRVAIARALAGAPGVILADEPTGNLDVATASGVAQLLLELHRLEKSTLVVVTHSLELAAMMDRTMELTPRGIVER